jgi:hypothetical protein
MLRRIALFAFVAAVLCCLTAATTQAQGMMAGSSTPNSTPSPSPIPPGAIFIDTSLCGALDASAGPQAALNAAAGGTPWIPAGAMYPK